ncbi:hypothetical protein HNR77_004037 [Paenibacillus sp. JGP012]|nr:hypothetical protein [Paenibacillus sp. JGP012]
MIKMALLMNAGISLFGIETTSVLGFGKRFFINYLNFTDVDKRESVTNEPNTYYEC